MSIFVPGPGRGAAGVGLLRLVRLEVERHAAAHPMPAGVAAMPMGAICAHLATLDVVAASLAMMKADGDLHAWVMALVGSTRAVGLGIAGDCVPMPERQALVEQLCKHLREAAEVEPMENLH